MKITQLEYFCATCRHHSITQAARELYVTASHFQRNPRIRKGIFHQSFRQLEKPCYTHKRRRIILSESPGHAALY